MSGYQSPWFDIQGSALLVTYAYDNDDIHCKETCFVIFFLLLNFNFHRISVDSHSGNTTPFFIDWRKKSCMPLR
jgi:hypothetical protein